jgi:hypothetical protein
MNLSITLKKYIRAFAIDLNCEYYNSSNTNDLVFKTANYSNSSFLTNTERMRITNTGRIGIGTSTPGVPIFPITNANDLSNCKLDISGSMRIYESLGSGGMGNSTIGSLVLQHGNPNGASSILFTGTPVPIAPSDPTGNDYGSITYYDNVAGLSNSGFPNYFGLNTSANKEASALVLDVGNNQGGGQLEVVPSKWERITKSGRWRSMTGEQ